MYLGGSTHVVAGVGIVFQVQKKTTQLTISVLQVFGEEGKGL